LKLAQWNHFSTAEREALVEKPCTTESEIKAYREFSNSWFNNIGAQQMIPLSPTQLGWMPPPFQLIFKRKLKKLGERHPQQWMVLTPVQRFDQTQPPSHENETFTALQEFHLL